MVSVVYVEIVSDSNMTDLCMASAIPCKIIYSESTDGTYFTPCFVPEDMRKKIEN